MKKTVYTKANYRAHKRKIEELEAGQSHHHHH